MKLLSWDTCFSWFTASAVVNLAAPFSFSHSEGGKYATCPATTSLPSSPIPNPFIIKSSNKKAAQRQKYIDLSRNKLKNLALPPSADPTFNLHAQHPIYSTTNHVDFDQNARQLMPVSNFSLSWRAWSRQQWNSGAAPLPERIRR